MTAAVAHIIDQVKALSPEDLAAFRDWLAKEEEKAAGERFARIIVEEGLGTARTPGARLTPFEPIRVEGTPVSELLIQERR